MPEIMFNPILTPGISTSGNIQRPSQNAVPAKSFDKVLNEELENTDSVKFSKHALSRLDTRDIALNSSDLQKLGSAVDAASAKGVKDSLVLLDGLAFIVDVGSRTVVTALPLEETNSSVFTNIDGAVIA